MHGQPDRPGAHTRPGDEILVQRFAHITTFEGGSAGAIHGLQSQTVGGLDGSMDPGEVRAAIRPDFIHCPRTALICSGADPQHGRRPGAGLG
ncbi:MAG: beta-eliminating lyase-related protein [Planctomycetota bacterium]